MYFFFMVFGIFMFNYESHLILVIFHIKIVFEYHFIYLFCFEIK
jgi:hypothetical protein